MLKHLMIFQMYQIQPELLLYCIKGNCEQTALKTSFALSLGADILASTLRLF